jgi:hypothetical protein
MAYQWIAAREHQNGDRNGNYKRCQDEQNHRGGDPFHTGQHWIGRNAAGIRLLSFLLSFLMSFLFEASGSHGYPGGNTQ